MNELDRLGRELRAELGAPPESWVRVQRQRLRGAAEPARNQSRARFVLAAAAAALAVLLALGFVALRGAHPARSDSVWLVAERTSNPYRLQDGSSIALSQGARGRLETNERSAHFELFGGIGQFEVTPRRDQHFTIVAGSYEISVVGTRFSVQFDPPDAVEVAVERGIVWVRAPRRIGPIQLQAGDRLRGRHGTFTLEQPAVSSSAAAEEPSAADAGLALGAVVAAPSPSVSSRVLSRDDWEKFYREGRYAESLNAAKEFGFDKLTAALAEKPLSELADAARLGGAPELALRALEALRRRFPGTPEAANALFLVGRMHAVRGESSAAIAELERYLRGRSSAPYAFEAMGRLVELYSARGEAARAQAMAQRYLEGAPNGPYRRLALSVLQK